MLSASFMLGSWSKDKRLMPYLVLLAPRVQIPVVMFGLDTLTILMQEDNLLCSDLEALEIVYCPQTGVTMSNRKARRADAKIRASDPRIPLEQPSREKVKEKTLLDIASERQLLKGTNSLAEKGQPSIVTTTINADGSLSHTRNGQAEELGDSPWVDVLLYSISLLTLYFTFTFLVHHQYAASPPRVMSLLSETFVSFTPMVLVLLVAILHPSNGHPIVQAIFAIASLTAGIEIVRISNEEAYLAVMRKAPALGVIWVWAAVESRWEVAAGTTAVVGAWTWYKGYAVY